MNEVGRQLPATALLVASSCLVALAGCVPGPPTVADIQGADQYSPHAASRVSFEGVVTALLPQEGFFVESPQPDRNPATSEGVLVIGGRANVGDRVAIEGVVVEVQRNPEELPLTTVSVNADGSGVRVLATDQTLPQPPELSMERARSLEAAIAHLESFEGMRVRVGSATVIGPSSRFGETAILVGGLEGLPREIALPSPRGAAVLSGSRYLPPRLLLDDAIATQPELTVGDRLGAFEAVVDYRFGEYRLYPLATLEPVERSSLEPEVTTLSAGDSLSRLTLATLNVQNLDLGDDPRRFQRLAATIVEALGAPDIVALQEMQDDSGPLDDGETGSEATHQRLIEAIRVAGGPRYAFREVRPGNNQDGGEPWGNIRCSFLFKNDARLRFVDLPAGDPSLTDARIASSRSANGAGPEVTPSPGRIAPGDPAFERSRKPLIGVFEIGNRRLVVINLHLASKGGDDPAYGLRQPPQRHTESQRNRQASIVAEFVARLLDADPEAAVVVAGDLNDFPFSQALAELTGVGLSNLVDRLPPEEQYSYLFRGQAQVLDHVLVSPALADSELDVVHVHSELPASRRESDHDPLVALIRF